MSRYAPALLLALGTTTRVALAQTPSESEIHHLQLEADSLAREWRQANSLANLADSVGQPGPPPLTDTIAVGAIRIISNRSKVPFQQAARQAWPILDSLYGPRAQILATRPYIVHVLDPVSGSSAMTPARGDELPAETDAQTLVGLLLVNAPVDQPDQAFQSWLGGPVRIGGQEFATVYVLMVSSPYQNGRACFLGDLAACKVALSLMDSVEIITGEYQTAAERRMVARQFATLFTYGRNPRLYRECVDGADSICVELLRSVLPWNHLPQVLSQEPRNTLTHLALRIGGRNAYDRLLLSHDRPVSERLALVAGIPLDSLVARWQAEVIRARPTSVAVPPLSLVMGVGWIVAFGCCGLRSSRWRLG